MITLDYSNCVWTMGSIACQSMLNFDSLFLCFVLFRCRWMKWVVV